MPFILIYSNFFKRVYLSAFLLLFSGAGKCQVNGHARVSSISGQTLTVTDVDESADSFEDGEAVIIMQMQDDVLGTATNTASFGGLGSIQSAGLWEVRTIASHTETAGTPTSITVQNALNNSYNISPNARVQVISFPSFGSPDYTTTGNMSAKDWDGNTGGAIAFKVPGTLTLLHDITADGAGFRGGAAEGTYYSLPCVTGDYRSPSSNEHGDKGEGIHRVTNNVHESARGKILNGGGGGNMVNAGGGGGGNYSNGGKGGPGWNCGGNSAGGFGGIDLSTHIGPGRFFMGGGGGGGEGNNSVASPGGDGGGIVIIKANEIRTTSSCSGVSVRANGDAAPPAGNDGAGGGGAGGTVHLLVDNWNIDASCPLTISSNGGGGSDVGAGSKHGAGGGGGQGAVIQSGATPGGNTTTNTQPGDGGKNCNSCSSTDPGGGSNGDGNINGGNSPLPIKLLYFQAERMRSNVRLSWRTASEHENERFTVQRSKNGKAWNAIQQVEGAGTSTSPIDYSTWDMDPLDDKSYYRLRQTDKNGAQSFSDPVVIGPWNEKEAPDIYPNPAGERVWVKFGSPMTVLRIYDQRGRERNIRTEISGEEGELYVSSLSSGIYFVEFGTEHQLVRKRLIVE